MWQGSAHSAQNIYHLSFQKEMNDGDLILSWLRPMRGRIIDAAEHFTDAFQEARL
jgi:hypothetical protein